MSALFNAGVLKAAAVSGVCFKFKTNLKILCPSRCVVSFHFKVKETHVILDLFFTVPVNDFWNADTSEEFSVQLRSCFTPCFLPPQQCMWSV